MIKRWNRLKTEMMILRSDILTGKVRFSLGPTLGLMDRDFGLPTPIFAHPAIRPSRGGV